MRPKGWKGSKTGNLYFALVAALGTAIAIGQWVLPRRARNRELAEKHRALEEAIQEARARNRRYETAIRALDTDPYYREAVVRRLLGLRAADEDWLEPPSARDRRPGR